MPTATTYMSIFSLDNLGPLTTTYTPPTPATCTNLASATDAAVVYSYMLTLMMPFGHVACGARPVGNCVPNGSKIDELEQSGKDARIYRIPYYSPGIQCPSGWTTATNVARGSTTTSPSKPTQITSHPFDTNWLDAGETLAVCCPSKYTMEPAFGGGPCQSKLGPITDYPYSTICDIDTSALKDVAIATGQDITRSFPINPNGGPITQFTREDIPRTARPDESLPVVFASIQPLYLVYKETDVKTGDKTKKIDGTSTGKPVETNSATNQDKKNTALPLNPTSIGVGLFCLLLQTLFYNCFLR